MAINPMGSNNISRLGRIQAPAVQAPATGQQKEVEGQSPVPQRGDGVDLSHLPVVSNKESLTAAPLQQVELPTPGKVTKSKPLGMSGAIAILNDNDSQPVSLGSGMIKPAGISNPRLVTLGGKELNGSGFNTLKELPGQELRSAPDGWNIAPNGIQSGLTGFQYIGS